MISIFSSCVILLRSESTRFSTSTLDGRTVCATFNGMKNSKITADSNLRLGMAVCLMIEWVGEKSPHLCDKLVGRILLFLDLGKRKHLDRAAGGVDLPRSLIHSVRSEQFRTRQCR